MIDYARLKGESMDVLDEIQSLNLRRAESMDDLRDKAMQQNQEERMTMAGPSERYEAVAQRRMAGGMPKLEVGQCLCFGL